MEQLIPVIEKNQEVLVSGRDLHDFLEIETPYRKWFPRMLEYGFFENQDYTPDIFVHPLNNQEVIDHLMKLDMAKELSMVQRTKKGKQARKYFINVEKEYKQKQFNVANLSPELQMFNRMFNSLAQQELEMKKTVEKQEQLETKVDGIKDLLSMDAKNWRSEVNNIIKKIAVRQGGFDKFKEIANESYIKLENKAHCKLDIRLENRRKNMIAQGMGKSTVKRLNKLDIISEDHRLKEIYVSVVKMMAIKYGLWER